MGQSPELHTPKGTNGGLSTTETTSTERGAVSKGLLQKRDELMLNESKPQSALEPELILKALKGATQAKRVLNGAVRLG